MYGLEPARSRSHLQKGGPVIGFALTSKTCHYICFFFFCFFGWINLFLEWLITCCFLPNQIQQWGSALLKMKIGLQFCVCFLMGRICRFHVVSFTISKCCLPQILSMHSEQEVHKTSRDLEGPFGCTSHIKSKVMVLLWCSKGVGWIECISACCECHIKSKVTVVK